MNRTDDVSPQIGIVPRFSNASLVADLTGWSGGITTQPWYTWLSPTDVLVRGGISASETSEGFTSRAAGQEGLVYKIGVRSGPGSFFDRMTRQPAVPLVALSRRAQDYGGISEYGMIVSPDGRLLLYLGKHRGEYYWCADSIAGNQHVAWRMKRPKTHLLDQSLNSVALSNASWLPDSAGILETSVEWDQFNTWNTAVVGHIRLLTSPESALLRLAQLGTIRESQCSNSDLDPPQMISRLSGNTIAIHPRCQTQQGDPNLASGGPLQSRPPDQLVVYHWDWLLSDQRNLRAQTEIITMPPGYSLFAKSISVGGDRLVVALMDRAHHYVVSTGGEIHPRHGDGKISMWTCEMRGGRVSSRLHEQCSFVVPFGKEAWCYQRFGLGDWLPGNRRFSFQFASNLYIVAVT